MRPASRSNACDDPRRWAGLADIDHLRSLGVRRLSAGSAISEAMHGVVLGMMREFLATGRLDGSGLAPLAYGDLQALMARH